MRTHHIVARVGYRMLQIIGALALLLCLSAWALPASTSENNAFIRLVHASPDVGIVAVFMDGKQILSSFQFATVTEYVPLPAGPHRVQLALLGKGVNAAMLSQTITVQPDQVYTVAVVGMKASGFSFDIFTDNNVVSGNQAKLRAYHLSPNIQSVSVNEGATTVIQGLGYQQVSGYLALSPGQHAFKLNGIPANAADSFSVTIQPWSVSSVFVIGLLNGKPGLQYVTAQVKGTPGLPNTGSDPNPQASAIVHTHTPSSPFWPTALWLMTVLGAGFGLYWMVSQRAHSLVSLRNKSRS